MWDLTCQRRSGSPRTGPPVCFHSLLPGSLAEKPWGTGLTTGTHPGQAKQVHHQEPERPPRTERTTAAPISAPPFVSEVMAKGWGTTSSGVSLVGHRNSKQVPISQEQKQAGFYFSRGETGSYFLVRRTAVVKQGWGRKMAVVVPALAAPSAQVLRPKPVKPSSHLLQNPRCSRWPIPRILPRPNFLCTPTAHCLSILHESGVLQEPSHFPLP